MSRAPPCRSGGARWLGAGSAGSVKLAPGYGIFDVGFEANLKQAGAATLRFLYRGPLYRSG